MLVSLFLGLFGSEGRTLTDSADGFHNVVTSFTIWVHLAVAFKLECLEMKVKVRLAPEQVMKAHAGWRYSSTLYLTSSLEGSGWLTPRPGRFTPGKDTRYPFTGGWVGPRAGLDGYRKSCFNGDSIPEASNT